MSVTKTEYMVFGPLPTGRLSLFVRGWRLSMVKVARYVGVFFSSVDRDVFAEHYKQKAKKARSKTHVLFAVRQFTGDVMPLVARRLYMAQIDPHLTAGCEVVLDVCSAHLRELERVEREFWRRALGLSARCSVFVLYTESGVMPLQYRRLQIALGYLRYVAQLGVERTVRLAQMDTFDLDRNGYSSWAGDLRYVLTHLPCPVAMPSWSDEDLANPEWHGRLQDALRVACEQYLREECAKSKKCWILQRRLASVDARGRTSPAMEFQSYLRVQNRDHRVALTRLICSDHDLAVESLRRGDGQRRKRIPREWRLCRFCVAKVETEAHALLECPASPGVVALREAFWADVRLAQGNLWRRLSTGGYHGDDEETLLVLLGCDGLHQRLAKFVFEVFEEYRTVAMFVPSEELFESFEDLPDGEERDV